MDFRGIIEQAANACAENISTNEGDYIGENGLLYCGKCNTPKQGEYKMPFGVVRPYCLCKCATEARDREAEEQKRKELAIKVRELRRMGFPESEMQHCTFDNDDNSNPKITQAMKNYVENFPEFKKQGQGLLLFGDVGTGKSFAAAAVANALIDKGFPVLVTNFARIANTVSGLFEGKQAYYDSLNRFALLVLDDLAAERKTEYMQEIVYNVIDSRYRAGLPMIITTNLTSQELKNPQEMSNKRIFDRVLERCLPIEVAGANRRHKKLAANIDDLRARLGL